jgi:hypothetical protein
MCHARCMYISRKKKLHVAYVTGNQEPSIWFFHESGCLNTVQLLKFLMNFKFCVILPLLCKDTLIDGRDLRNSSNPIQYKIQSTPKQICVKKDWKGYLIADIMIQFLIRLSCIQKSDVIKAKFWDDFNYFNNICIVCGGASINRIE